MAKLGFREAAQVTENAQDMLIDGIDVKQIVLHLTHDGAEFRQVITKNFKLVHAPHFVQNTTRGLEQANEIGFVHRVGAKTVIDQRACPPERTNCPCRHPFERLVGLHQQEGFEDGLRRLIEDVFIDNIE